MVGEVSRCLTVYRQPYIKTRFHSFLANIQNSSPFYVSFKPQRKENILSISSFTIQFKCIKNTLVYAYIQYDMRQNSFAKMGNSISLKVT